MNEEVIKIILFFIGGLIFWNMYLHGYLKYLEKRLDNFTKKTNLTKTPPKDK